MLFTALPLSLQHAVSPCKYYIGHKTYGFLIFILEIWFQMEYFHIVPYLDHALVFIGLTTLLLAHYIWLFRAVVWGLWGVVAPEERILLSGASALGRERAGLSCIGPVSQLTVRPVSPPPCTVHVTMSPPPYIVRVTMSCQICGVLSDAQKFPVGCTVHVTVSNLS